MSNKSCLLFFILSSIPVILFAQSESTNYYEIGLRQIQAGKYESAKSCFTSAIEINPDDQNAYFNRGVVNYHLGSLDSACIDWNYAALTCDLEAIELINLRCDSIFRILKSYPEFHGGENELFIFLQKNVKYPKEARAAGASGNVFVSFTVKSDGSLIDVRVEKPIGYGFDEEAIRVVKSMPRWTPGMLCNKPVKVRFMMPLSFSTGTR